MAGKTNAVRLVNQAGIPCRESFYEYDEKDLSGIHAARAIGMDATKGSIEAGKDADLIVTDRDFNVKKTIIQGDIRYEVQN